MTSFRNLNQTTGRLIHQHGQYYLFFGGTAYLGLLNNPAYISLYKEGMDTLGLNNGTSRTNNVQLGIYEQAEQQLAKRFGFDDSILVSSGYLAAQLAVRQLAKSRQVLYAPDTHPSLWLDDNPMVSGTFAEWLEQAVAEINGGAAEEYLVIGNAIDNLTPQLYDYTALLQVSAKKKITLVLDDSHGLGVMKLNSTTVDVSALRDGHIDVVVVASLAKGLGTDAGIILSDSTAADSMRQHPIFTGASPSSPGGVYALLHGQDIYVQAFYRMQANANLLRPYMKELPIHSLPHFPVFSSSAPHLYRHLIQKNILVSSFPYPLPESPLLNRIIVSASHTEDDIRHLGEILLSEKY